MRIAISGTSGVGKTILSKKLSKKLEIHYIPDVIGDILKKNGFNSWLDCNSKSLEKKLRQEALEKKIELELKNDKFVSDKSVIDYLAYWLIWCSQEATDIENNKFKEMAESHSSSYTKVVVPKFGIYEVEDNKIRNLDYFHRLRIHCLIKGIHEEMGIEFQEYNYNFKKPIEEVIEELNLNKKFRKNVGLFLGTFDPIHNGHIIIAKMSREILDEVWIQPQSENPKGKKHETLKNRIKMIELNTLPKGIQIRLNPKGYDPLKNRENTILQAREEFPEYNFWMIMGSDKLDHPAYYPGGILLQVPHIVFTRGEIIKGSIEKFRKITLIEHPKNISSSIIKERIKQRKKISNLVPKKVEEYIKKEELYLNYSQ